MKSSKIIQYLRTLHRDEWYRFDRFVRTGYFNTHIETIKLWEVFYAQSSDLSDSAVAKQDIFKKAFPQQEFDERKLYKLSKYLLQLLTEFLILEKRKQEVFQREFLTLIPILAERKLDRYIPRLVKQAEAQLAQLRMTHNDTALLEYQYLFLQMNYALSRDNRSMEAGITAASQKLDQYYVLEKLKLAVPIANRNYILAKEAELDFVEEALKMYAHSQWEDYPLLRAYYLALTMLQKFNIEQHFTDFAQYLSQKGTEIPKEESRALYVYGLNFCSIQSKRGNPAYLEKMFNLYEEMLRQDFLLSDPSSAAPNFKNAVTLGIKLKKYDWTEQFILQYGPKLPESHRTIITHYSSASLAFERTEYSIALKHLLEVNFLDPFYRLIYDILLLKIYYEIGEADSLYFRYRAFRKYIQRDKVLSENNRKAYSNFARILFKIGRYSFDRLGKRETLEKMLRETKLLVQRQWLEEKIQAL